MQIEDERRIAHREALEAYARQMAGGMAAIEELRAMRRLFAILCEREGGSITISASDLDKAQRMPERIATVHVDPESGDVTISV